MGTFINRHYITNNLDLVNLICLKVIFSYFAFELYTNFLGLSFFKYPDMEAYKDCIGDGAIMVIFSIANFYALLA